MAGRTWAFPREHPQLGMPMKNHLVMATISRQVFNSFKTKRTTPYHGSWHLNYGGVAGFVGLELV
jgi:hypothetical protein